jgi:hypothetical protein
MQNGNGAFGTGDPRTASSARTGNLASVPPPRRESEGDLVRSHQLSFELLDVGEHAGRERRLEQAYRCWHEVWSETFHQLDGVERVHSDEFTRQHEIGALFLNDVCIGLIGHRWIDLSLSFHQDDSYFKVWPKNALRLLQRDGSNVCIGSHLTVLPAWRGRQGGTSVKDLLLALSIRRFLASSADALAGTMRNDRAMNVLSYDLGFTPVFEGAIHHGVKVDLVAFYRDVLVRPPTTAAEERMEELWADAQRRRSDERGSRKVHRRA